MVLSSFCPSVDLSVHRTVVLSFRCGLSLCRNVSIGKISPEEHSRGTFGMSGIDRWSDQHYSEEASRALPPPPLRMEKGHVSSHR